MRAMVRIAVLALAVFAATVFVQPHVLQAQGPPPGGPPGGEPAPKNLKVLPKDMSRREVIDVMRNFTNSLGVHCIECHVSKVEGSERPEDMDYAADKKDEKEAARNMMKMVDTINGSIGKMGFKDPVVQVGCFTCHHGTKVPQKIQQIMQQTITDKGVDPAIDQYRKLRTDYYGSAAYDFSPEALNEVAGNLAQTKKDFDGATKIVNLSLEYDAKNSYTYVTLGQIQLAKGDKPAAIASFQKAVDLDPDNRRAKMMLDRAKGGQ